MSKLPETIKITSYFITGATGGVGLSIAEFLREKGLTVYTLVRPTSSNRRIEKLYELGCKLVEGDILDPDTYQSVLSEIDVVIHTAAYVNPSDKSELHTDVNFIGTQLLVDEMIYAQCSKLIHISTCGVYGYNQSEPISEHQILNPRSRYAITKLQAEDYIITKKEIDTVIIRCPFIISRYDQIVIPTLLKVLNRKISIKILGRDGKSGFLHTDDLCSFIILVSAKKVNENRIYNLQSGVLSYEQMRSAVNSLSDKKQITIPIPYFFLFIIAPILNVIKFIKRKELNGFRRVKSIISNWTFSTERAKHYLIWDSKYNDKSLYIEFQSLLKDVIR
jgi:nucleoside-diphosphate-sugar epimerase